MIAHVVAHENNGLRLRLLEIYARHEVFILSLLYRLLGSRLMRWRPAAEAVFYLLAYPAAKWGIAGTPVAPDDLEAFLAESARVAVGPCRCRTAHGSCSHPLRTDIVVRTGFGVWTGLFPSEYQEITVGEALKICRDCHQQGMAQISYAHMDLGGGGSVFVICNCCSDGCLPLLSRRQYGAGRYPFNRGRRRAYVETDRCEGCARCVEYCVFEARSIGPDGKARVADCYGCGLCASHCQAGAARLV